MFSLHERAIRPRDSPDRQEKPMKRSRAAAAALVGALLAFAPVTYSEGLKESEAQCQSGIGCDFEPGSACFAGPSPIWDYYTSGLGGGGEEPEIGGPEKPSSGLE
jgi:hypothetical protein